MYIVLLAFGPSEVCFERLALQVRRQERRRRGMVMQERRRWRDDVDGGDGDASAASMGDGDVDGGDGDAGAA